MDTADIKQKYQNRDRVVRIVSTGSKFRAVCVRNTQAANTAMEKHRLSATATTLLARAMACASMLSSFLTGEERIIVQADGGGKIRRVYAESIHVGEVRGFAREAEAPAEGLSDGIFKVQKIIYNRYKPVEGIVKLQRGDIASEFAGYLEQSEQTATFAHFATELQDGAVKESWAFMVQPLPGTPESDFALLKNEIDTRLPRMQGVYQPNEILLHLLPFDFQVADNTPVDFFCRCSLDNFKQALRTLDRREIEEMQRLQQNELTCHYCNKEYRLSQQDFQELLASGQKKRPPRGKS